MTGSRPASAVPARAVIAVARGGAILLLLLLASTGCSKSRDAAGSAPQAASQVPPAPAAEHAPLAGDSPQAWLTGLGSLGDANYCRAEMLVPFAHEPAWVCEYTAGQFSASGPQEILHYDGLLAVMSFSAQLLGLNPRTGDVIFNRDIYQRDLNAPSQNNEMLAGLFINPRGLILGLDAAGRYYLWSTSQGSPRQLWLHEADAGASTMVAGPDRWYGVWNGVIHGLKLDDGRELWAAPGLLDNGGLVVSADGLVVWYRFGDVRAMDGATGALKWSLSAAQVIDRVMLNDEQRAAYVIYYDEHLERRDLATGELVWSYDWSDVLPESERRARLSRYSALPIASRAGMTLAGVRAGFQEASTGPDGVYLALLSGHVLAVDPGGKLRWSYRGPCPAVSGLEFSNAYLAIEAYQSPQTPRPYVELLPFCLDEPPWQRLQAAQGAARTDQVFWSIVALDAVSGAVLDQFEPDQFITCGPVPAYNMLVLGEQAMAEGEHNRVIAYPWLKGEKP